MHISIRQNKNPGLIYMTASKIDRYSFGFALETALKVKIGVDRMFTEKLETCTTRSHHLQPY